MTDMELEQSSIEFKPVRDKRPHMPEPPPVRLVAVEDVHVQAAAGLEVQLDQFYVELLKFEREDARRTLLVYRAENFRLCVQIVEPPFARPDLRPIGIDVPSLSSLQQVLIDRQIEHQWQKGLAAGQDTLLLQDPAGNWVQIGQIKRV